MVEPRPQQCGSDRDLCGLRRPAFALAGAIALVLAAGHGVGLAQDALRPADGVGLVGDPDAGKVFWETLATSSCKNCHGTQGQGGFAPALAGRALTTEDFIRAITLPAIMPTFPQYDAQQMADFAAHFARLPVVTVPAPWRFAMPPDAEPGLMVAFAIGCAQCHGPELETPRHNAGAVFADADFEWFKTHIYEHNAVVWEYWAMLELERKTPYARMGTYSRDRLPEAVLEQIWGWMTEEGLLTPVTASLPRPEMKKDGAVYTLTLINQGLRGKGLVAETVTVRLVLPSGAQVVEAVGGSFQGIQPDPESGAAAAHWTIAEIGPHDRAEIKLTLALAGANADDLRGYAVWLGQDTKRPERLNLRVGQRPRSFP